MTIAGTSVITLLLVLLAGVGAGFVGYAVGASSLVSYPALLALGIPPVLSNTTNTVGVVGTGFGGCLSARRELSGHRTRVVIYAVIGVLGGVIGGLLLLELPPEVFEYLVPPLILFSALIIALNPRERAHARDAVGSALGPTSAQAREAAVNAAAHPKDDVRRDPWWMWLGISFVGIYSGYFGAGAGTLALAMLDVGRIGPFHEINALKTVVGFGANVTASVMFIVRGSVNWPFAVALCAGCFIGSYIAPPVTRRIPAKVMRAAAVIAGVILAVKLGWSTYL
ncbi:permease [Bifidobacterium sp. DSM 109958]|uniref:Probable membrane transporter protein n=1 Tax=Bifidobacterium moraviense TaxID=2675323 RepID=A0A7Y0HYM2_9BIFI|nr:sulfite exporter TauE/SafE family protein [Bifidobacterium sp. DSM 109958]NMM99497.1 permease [Bifidobacterium sp. DSM 109958]